MEVLLSDEVSLTEQTTTFNFWKAGSFKKLRCSTYRWQALMT